MATKQNNPTRSARQLQADYWKAKAEALEQELAEAQAAWTKLNEVDLPALEERMKEQSRLRTEAEESLGLARAAEEAHRALEELEDWVDPLVVTPDERADLRVKSKAKRGLEYSFYMGILERKRDGVRMVRGLVWYYGGRGWKIPKEWTVVAYRVYKTPRFMVDR